MNIKKYAFRFAVTVTAFFLGLSAYTGYQYITGPNEWDDYDKCHSQLNNSDPGVTAEPLVPMIESTAEVDSIHVDYSNRTGEYYLSYEDLPRDFKNIEYIEVVTHEYDELADADDPWRPVPVTGAVHTKSKYQFKTVSVSSAFLVFETETKNGISYRFVGRFPAPDHDSELALDLEGELQKLKNGVVTRSIKAVFFLSGC